MCVCVARAVCACLPLNLWTSRAQPHSQGNIGADRSQQHRRGSFCALAASTALRKRRQDCPAHSPSPAQSAAMSHLRSIRHRGDNGSGAFARMVPGSGVLGGAAVQHIGKSMRGLAIRILHLQSLGAIDVICCRGRRGCYQLFVGFFTVLVCRIQQKCASCFEGWEIVNFRLTSVGCMRGIFLRIRGQIRLRVFATSETRSKNTSMI